MPTISAEATAPYCWVRTWKLVQIEFLGDAVQRGDQVAIEIDLEVSVHDNLRHRLGEVGAVHVKAEKANQIGANLEVGDDVRIKPGVLRRAVGQHEEVLAAKAGERVVAHADENIIARSAVDGRTFGIDGGFLIRHDERRVVQGCRLLVALDVEGDIKVVGEVHAVGRNRARRVEPAHAGGERRNGLPVHQVDDGLGFRTHIVLHLVLRGRAARGSDRPGW